MITTARLVLREMTVADYGGLAQILQDPETMTAYEGAFSESATRGWLARRFQQYAQWGHSLWAVTFPEAPDQMIGQCGLTYQDIEGESVLEVGYLFNRAYWGQGYATEAARACVDHAFAELGADQVFAIIRDTNLRSMNVAIRCGMEVRCRFTKHYRGVDMPHLAFSVRRTDRGGRDPH